MSNLATITNNILADSGIDDINVIVSTGSYANPAWITSLAWTKITGAPTIVGGVTASSPLFSSGGTTPNITIQQASGLQNGFLSSTDWNTFNSKQTAGNYVTTDTNQNITGEKTFSGLALQLAAAGTANGTILRNTSATTASTTGFNTIGFNSVNNIFVSTQSRGGFILGFNNSVSNRQYDLPDASGTIALTSNLSGYLPLSGGTLTGALNGTSASFVSTGTFLSNAGSTIFEKQIIIANTGGSMRAGVESSVGEGIQLGTLPYAAVFGNQANAATQFTTNGTARMTIVGGGNVLIGTTTDNGARLQVSGDQFINATQTYTLSLNNTAQDVRMQLQVNGTQTFQLSSSSSQVNIYGATNIPMIFYANATERMRITSGGNVGIGTASPSSRLHVAGDFRTVLTSGVGGDTLIAAINGVSNGYIINVDTSNNITHTWNTGANAAALRITPSGNVLIGTTTENGARLQVSGNGVFSNSGGYPFIEVQGGTNQGGGFKFSGSSTVFAELYGEFESSNNGMMIFRTRRSGTLTEALRIASTGAATFSSTLDTLGRVTITADSGNEQFTIRRASNTNAQLITGVHSSGYAWMQSIEQNVAYRPLVLNRDSGNVLIGTTTDNGDRLRVNGTTFTNEIMTWNPQNDNRSGVAWRLGAATIGTDILNRRLRVNVGGVEYYIGAVEV